MRSFAKQYDRGRVAWQTGDWLTTDNGERERFALA